MHSEGFLAFGLLLDIEAESCVCSRNWKSMERRTKSFEQKNGKCSVRGETHIPYPNCVKKS